MSFASGIKSELLRIENKKACCALAELCGILCFGGTREPKDGEICLRILTENAASARRCFLLFKQCFGIVATVLKNRSRLGGNAYGITVCGAENVNRVLEGLLIFDKEKIYRHIPEKLVKESCCMRAFLRGAFLGGGSVTNPEKEYHLEFSMQSKTLAEELSALFENFDLAARIVLRKTSYVVYFKNSEEIGDVLNIIGATRAYMELMNIRILKETRNNVNRKVNCETANMDKAIEAAMVQIQAIKKLQKSGKLETLPPTLVETGLARLGAPDASMAELGKALGISKSGINHRMRKLMEIATNENKTGK